MSTELIRSVTGLDTRQARVIEECATLISAGFPVLGLDLIPIKNNKGEVIGHKPYINRLGAEWLINADDRGVKSIISRPLMSAFRNDKGWAEYKCTITMWDGSRYVQHGSDQQIDRWKTNETAETRAFVRCVKLATAGMLMDHANRIGWMDDDGQVRAEQHQ